MREQQMNGFQNHHFFYSARTSSSHYLLPVVSRYLNQTRRSIKVLGCFHTHRLFAGAGNGSATGIGLWVFTHTDIAGTVGQFVFLSNRREMCPHVNRRRYRKWIREYWVHPLLPLRYMEGSFYTLFEKL